jgi:hypothetical protein
MRRITLFIIAAAIAAAVPAEAQVAEPTRQEQPPAQNMQAAAPVDSFRFGIGGRVGGSSLGVGASVRGWMSPTMGVDLQVSRFGYNLGVANASVTQIAPVVLYRFPQSTTDGDIAVRPYVGGGLNFFRSLETYEFLGEREQFSDTSMGIQFLGGAELLFRDAPRFAVSIDIGYHSTGRLFDAISIGGIAYGVSAHWYVK